MSYGTAFHPRPVVQQVLQGFGGPPRVFHPRPIVDHVLQGVGGETHRPRPVVEQVLQGLGATALKFNFTPAQVQAIAQKAVNTDTSASRAAASNVVAYYGSQNIPIADLPGQCRAQGGTWDPTTSVCTVGGATRSQSTATGGVSGIPTVALVAAGAVAVGAAYYFLIYSK